MRSNLVSRGALTQCLSTSLAGSPSHLRPAFEGFTSIHPIGSKSHSREPPEKPEGRSR